MKPGSIVIVPRSEFQLRYQSTRCEQFYPKLKVLDSTSSSLECKIYLQIRFSMKNI